MPKLKLTQAAVERLKPPPSGRIEYWDATLPGFGVRLSAPRPGSIDGRRTWQVMYRVNGKLSRETLGTVASIPNVGDARELARHSMTKARAGTNPVEEKRVAEAEQNRLAQEEAARKANTLAAVISRYLAERPTVNSKGRPLSREYLDEIKRTLTRDVAASKLGSEPIDEVDGQAIKGLVRGIAKTRPAHGNHVLAYLTTALQWAVDENVIRSNPAIVIDAPAPRIERDRILEDDGIRLFWCACDKIGWPFGPFDQLLLLTAQRRDELAHALRSEFDLEQRLWTLPGARTKNGRSHIVHLSSLAVEILKTLPGIGSGGLLFTTGRRGDNPISGWSASAKRLAGTMIDLLRSDPAQPGADTSEATIEPFTRHDLRRTATTGMARLGVAPHVVDKLLNHTTGKISGVAAIYNRFEYLAERKAAIELWSRHIESLIRPIPSNVVVLAAAR
jgi:integrase